MSSACINLSLCGCGFLGVYHLGVATCLTDHAPSLLKSLKRVGGASAGALAGAALLLGRDKLAKSVQFSHNLADDIRRRPLGALTPRYNILNHLHRFLAENLPDDAHLVATDKLFVSLSAIKGHKNEIVYEYTSKEHLIQCLLASCYIPVYAGVKPPKIRGKRYMDGGITNNLINFVDGRTITVSPFSGKQDISPRDKVGRGLFVRLRKQNFQVNRKNCARLIDAFLPPPRNTLESYYRRGYRDAELFLREQGFYEYYEEIAVQPKETTV